jgi:hypothetical protein
MKAMLLDFSAMLPAALTTGVLASFIENHDMAFVFVCCASAAWVLVRLAFDAAPSHEQ